MSVKSELVSLANAIRSKTGDNKKLTIPGMTEAVNSISLGGGAIEFGYWTSTNTFQKIDLSGDSIENVGEPTTVLAYTFNTGYTIDPDYGTGDDSSGGTGGDSAGGSGGVDVSGVTATAGDVLNTVKFVDNTGTLQSGTIATITATLADNVVTIPQGYIAQAQTLTVAEMSEPSVSANVVTIGKGYNKAQKTVTIPEATVTNDGETATVSVGYVKTPQQFNLGSGGVNLPDGITVKPSDVRFDVTYIDANGQKQSGTMNELVATPIILETADEYTLEDGYYASCTIVLNTDELDETNIRAGSSILGVAGTFTADATATAADILSGKTAYVNGKMVTGSYVPSSSGAEDYPSASYMVDNNIVTITPGIFETETMFEVGIEYTGDDEIVPGTANTEIPANTYLPYSVNVKGDSNLVASNIKKDVTLFGVKGTYTEGSTEGGTDFYECASYTPALEGGEQYSFELTGADDTEANGTYTCVKYVEDVDPETDEYVVVSKWVNDTGYYLIEECGYAEFSYNIYTASDDYLYSALNATPDRITDFNQFAWTDWVNGEEVLLSFSERQVTELPPTTESWSGYKMEQNTETGMWVKAETLTEGLEIKGYTPEVGKIYSEDTTLMIGKIFAELAGELLALYHFDNTWDDTTGKTSISRNDYIYQFESSAKQFGEASVKFKAGAELYTGNNLYYPKDGCAEITLKNLPETDAFTIEWWQRVGNTTDVITGDPVLSDSSRTKVLFAPEVSLGRVFYQVFKHVAFVRKQGSTDVTMYIDGIAKGTTQFDGVLGGGNIYFWGLAHKTTPIPGYMDELAIFNYAKYDKDFTPPDTAYSV